MIAAVDAPFPPLPARNATMARPPTHLVDWKEWSDDDVRAVLALARRVKQNRWEFQGHLQGRTLVMLFQKTSTRTRVSFEAGMTELGS